MRSTRIISNAVSRVRSLSGQQAGVNRGWTSVIDRDSERVSTQVTLMAQYNTQGGR